MPSHSRRNHIHRLQSFHTQALPWGLVAMAPVSVTPRFALVIFMVALISAQNSTVTDRRCTKPDVEGLVFFPDETEYNVTANVTVTCQNDTFTLIGQQMITCSSDGSWNKEDEILPTCVYLPCPYPDVFPNGKFTLAVKESAVVMKYTCNPPNVLVGVQEQNCLPNEGWSGSVPQCLMDCGPPASPANGSVQFDCTHAHCTVTYSCQVGFKADTVDKTNSCNLTGHWEEDLPSCLKIECPVLQEMKNGSYIASTSLSSEGSYAYNTTVSFYCNETFVLDGSPSLICKEDGAWSYEQPLCVLPAPHEESTVKPTAAIASESRETTQEITTGVNFTNTTVQVTTQNPSTTITVINKTDTLDKNVTDLEVIVKCPSPKPFPNGHYHTYGGHKRIMIKYECDHGYVLNGNSSLECMDNGTWNGDAPNCVVFKDASPDTATKENFSWMEAFKHYTRWRGCFIFRKKTVDFKLQVMELEKDGKLKATFILGSSKIQSSQIEVSVSQKEASKDIVIELDQHMTKKPDNFLTQDWTVEGRLTKNDCLWYYDGKIWSPIEGYEGLTMHPVDDDWHDIRSCDKQNSTAAVVAGITIATIGVMIVVIVAIYCTKKRGGLRSYGHKSLTSFENPVYEYEHGLK